MHVTKCMHEALNQNVGRLFVTEILFSTDQYEPHAESTLIRLHELMSWPTVSTINIPKVDCTHIYKKIYYIAQTPNTSQTLHARYGITIIILIIQTMLPLPHYVHNLQTKIVG